ncbi:MAG: thiamine phosphate synthase [Parvibaculum sp.]|nr:thiamine phosphate synthase [Parvibaculum sp.]
MRKNLDRVARAVRYLDPDGTSVALIAMTGPKRLPDPWAALAALPRGSALIWRAYDKNPDYETARQLTAAARKKGCVLIVAGSPQLGRRLGIAGIHLPERDIARHRRDTPGALVTTACHSERAIIAASKAGADAVLISPVLPTESHPGGKVLGVVRLARLAMLAGALGMPAYALGGITDETHIRRLQGTGIAGVAGISLFLP